MKGLGRRPAPDSRDARFPLTAVIPATSTRRWRYWGDNGWWGNQGSRPFCVGYGWAHWLEDGPMGHLGIAPVVAPEFIYAQAQLIDEWPGEDYDGTSVRAGAKVLQSLGFVREYRWASTLEEIVVAVLEKGPVVVGTDWYSGMHNPTNKGRLVPEGTLLGGHCYVINGVTRVRERLRIKNSHGRDYGNNGRGWISFDDFADLLASQGEACLAVEVR